ncbi:zinc-dependent alcohol dehydrogenase family protein [Pectobacterium sp. A5351]|uniref:zinc-dependent alcohol dehydrogenase family protein n=1 Tax=Pectobacterium sp. A5351 TaxID=2914983 RepID=UPI00232EB0C1|nr:zinc-dependent alcohol dehydrogenase family protein [Pectobacterium sp. A5351]WCG82657.1 zinc-dependent alcohol dehydrogenase family protein [Pectobacterium sp. A5351]
MCSKEESKTYTRAFVREFGLASKCVAIENYIPEPLSSEMVSVRMRYSTINPSDLITISGAYKSRIELPFVPGFEGVGIIRETGTSVNNFAVGQRVLPLGSMGAWQGVRNIDAKWCFSIPDDISEEHAATGYINPMTAFLIMSERLITTNNTRIMINAANSAIGRMLIRIANNMGIYPIAVVRHMPDSDFFKDCAVQRILVSHAESYHHDLAQIKKEGGVDAVLDCIGGDDAMCTSRAVKQGGQFIHYGLLSGKAIPTAFWKERPDIDFSHFHLRQWIHNTEKPLIQNKIDEVMQLIRSHVIYTHISEVFDIKDLSFVIQSIMAGKIKGKVLITC